MKKHPSNSLSPIFARAARSTKRSLLSARLLVFAAASLACFLPAAQGAIFTVPAPDNPAMYDDFGWSVGISGSTALVGAAGKNTGTGATYFYTGVYSDTPTGTKLTTSDTATTGDSFGSSVGISGTTAIVGAYGKDSQRGAAYIYTGVDSGTPTVILKLTASDRAAYDYFGYSVGISGTTAIVGTWGKGIAYIYTGVNSVTPTEIKLTTSDNPTASDYFGRSVGISGTIAIVGAYGKNSNRGAAYIYTGVDSVTPTEIKLTASDNPTASDYFGSSVGISGTTAIVGAYGKNSTRGAAYIYTGIGLGTPVETKLTTSDNLTAYDNFGYSVGISGTIAIVGAPGKNSTRGAVYLYAGVDLGTPTEILKLSASDEEQGSYLGNSVSMDGDNFIAGAYRAASGTTSYGGKAYAGQVSTFTTVDSGNVTRETGGLSFVSQTDWIIGDTTGNNTVTLSKLASGAWYPDIAVVTAPGKAVYIGKRNGVSSNTLIVEGNLTANKIYIGSVSGANNNTLVVSANTLKGGVSGLITAGEIHIGSKFSQGNVLKLDGAVSVALATGTTVWLHRDNMLIIKGVSAGSGPEGKELPLTPTKVAEELTAAGVQLKAGWLTEGETLVSTANAEQLISTRTSPDLTGYTIVLAAGVIPEPSTYALWGSGLLAGLVFLRHRRRRKG
ncbi:MAG: FG-GAP repeat protein [Puniceicoccales bacterium]|jgi:hypothetical protein|nr:FG-GAP repeat protein [Puniceicoccales bacterium]